MLSFAPPFGVHFPPLHFTAPTAQRREYVPARAPAAARTARRRPRALQHCCGLPMAARRARERACAVEKVFYFFLGVVFIPVCVVCCAARLCPAPLPPLPRGLLCASCPCFGPCDCRGVGLRGPRKGRREEHTSPFWRCRHAPVLAPARRRVLCVVCVYVCVRVRVRVCVCVCVCLRDCSGERTRRKISRAPQGVHVGTLALVFVRLESPPFERRRQCEVSCHESACVRVSTNCVSFVVNEGERGTGVQCPRTWPARPVPFHWPCSAVQTARGRRHACGAPARPSAPLCRPPPSFLSALVRPRSRSHPPAPPPLVVPRSSSAATATGF